VNPYEEHKREQKAIALADVLEAREISSDFARLAPAGSIFWRKAAEVADRNEPSQQTIDLTVELLSKREEAKAAVRMGRPA
jgi:hypothetical protein